MGGNGTDIFRQVTKGIALEAARMRGQQRRRKRTDQMPVMGKDRPDRLHRAAAVAGYIMDGSNCFRHAGGGIFHLVIT